MTWRGLSVFGLLLVLIGALMLAPAAYAFGLDDAAGAKAFLLSAVIAAFAGGFVAFALLSGILR